MSFVISPAGAETETVNKGISSVSLTKDGIQYNLTLVSGTLTPSLEDFHQLLLIGRGATCPVYLVHEESTGQFYALKQMSKSDQAADIEQEQSILKTITTLPDAPRSLLSLVASWADKDHFYILTPWYEGKDLSTTLVNGTKFALDRVKNCVAQLLLAVELLYSLNVIHRDLKPANIFLTKEGNVVLGDFGFSKRFRTTFMNGAEEPTVDPDATSGSFLVPTFEDLTCTTSDSTGILHWMSPAQHAGTEYSFDADMWALGLLMFRMLTGRLPFNGDDANDVDTIQVTYATEEVEFRPEDGVDPCAQDLIRGLLNKDPHQRTTLAEAKTHLYFNGINWTVAARHTGPATWAPRKPYVPEGPHKTLLTMDALYQNGQDDFPGFVFVKPGFFDPPPGHVKAFVLKVDRALGCRGKKEKTKVHAIMGPLSRVPIKTLDKPGKIFHTIQPSMIDNPGHQVAASEHQASCFQVARLRSPSLASKFYSFFRRTLPTPAPSSFLSVFWPFCAGRSSTPRIHVDKASGHKAPTTPPSCPSTPGGPHSLSGSGYKFSPASLLLEFLRRPFRFKVKCGSLKNLDLTTC
ncbi:kinase-like domain-containing protein [Mycena sanguinolenta]|nr:kinase-like domain-containing protein [Mycena sanguinolenta]